MNFSKIPDYQLYQELGFVLVQEWLSLGLSKSVRELRLLAQDAKLYAKRYAKALTACHPLGVL
jgi:hypothetical protein